MYRNVDRISNAVLYFDKQNNNYIENIIPFGEKISGITTHQYSTDLNSKQIVDSINDVKEKCGFPILTDTNCCYFSINDINGIRSLLKNHITEENNCIIYTNYSKIKDGDSNYNDLCDRILICELLNHYKHIFNCLNNESFINILNRSWVESNEINYGPDLKFINIHSQYIELYGDVECYVNDKKQCVYTRKLKTDNESYYIGSGLNTDLNNVYVFRFVYDKFTGQIQSLICYNINDINELSMDVKYNISYPDDKRMILDERRSIKIDLTKFNIIRQVRTVNDTLNQGIEQIYFNGKLLRESDQIINYKLVKKREVK